MNNVATSATQVVCAILLVCASTVAPAQDRSAAQSSSVRLRSALARELHDSLTRVLSAARADSAFPGAYAIVGDSRGILAEHGVGRLDWKASARRPTRSSIWDLASITKILATTTALAQLVERGLVELDAPVHRYLPDWIGDGREAVTIRHLLTHTSGLPAFKDYDKQTQRPDSLATLIYWTPLERPPGERMVYSDIGAYMMGAVVERVSGDSLHFYVRKHIASPLRLQETMFRPPRSVWDRVAPTEIDTLRGGLVRGFVHDERAYYLGGVAAHAGLFGSARDLARFATMMLRRGTLDGARILRPETVAQFTAYADSTFSDRALGWQKLKHSTLGDTTPSAAWSGTGRWMSSRAYGHTGFTGTSLAIDPDLDLYVILLSNRVNPTRANQKISGVRRRLADAIVGAVRSNRGLTINAEQP
jgi:CubicO group peptidase (beta-lactamase class C family)